MPRRLSPRATSVLLLSGVIAVSCVSGTILSIVAEIRLVDASVALAMFVSVISIDFVQMKDCVVVFV